MSHTALLALVSALMAPQVVQAQPAPAAAVLREPTSLAVDPATPRTADGRPDLQNVVWETPHFGPMPVMPAVLPADLVIPESEAAAAFQRMIATFIDSPALALDPEAPDLIRGSKGLPVVRGERRTRLIVQPAAGRPPWTPAALGEFRGLAALFTQKADNPEDRMPSERCIALGGIPPIAILNSLSPRQFVVTRTHVVVHTEYGDEVRIIPFSDTHGPAVLAGEMGDSIARWDGDTLVIETTHNPVRQRIRPMIPAGVLIVNPDARVTERYTRISADEMLYQFTIEDPKIYSAPWLAEYSLYRATYPMFPSSCHEGNYGLENILAGARQEELRAAGEAP